MPAGDIKLLKPPAGRRGAGMFSTTLYLVGHSPEDAKTHMPFDDPLAAQEYAQDFGLKVYTVDADVRYVSEPYLTYTEDGWPVVPKRLMPGEKDQLKTVDNTK